MGLFIAVCGTDAAGKHTHSERLKSFYKDIGGYNVTKFDLPHYQSLTGEMISGYLQGDWRVELSRDARFRHDGAQERAYMNDPSTYMFQCAQVVNRLETLPDSLWHQNDRDVYIADRYTASAFAYGLAFGLDFDWLVKIHRHLPKPDLNILLDVTVEESFKRRPERRDNYERDGAMLERVRQCYHEVFSTMGPTYAVVDASGSKDETFGKILQCLEDRKLL